MPERDSLDRQQERTNDKSLPTGRDPFNNGAVYHYYERIGHDNNGVTHHHHGPDNNDILIHQHNHYDAYHQHIIAAIHDNNARLDNYGPLIHDHTGDTDRPTRHRAEPSDTDWVGWSLANDARTSANL